MKEAPKQGPMSITDMHYIMKEEDVVGCGGAFQKSGGLVMHSRILLHEVQQTQICTDLHVVQRLLVAALVSLCTHQRERTTFISEVNRQTTYGQSSNQHVFLYF